MTEKELRKEQRANMRKLTVKMDKEVFDDIEKFDDCLDYIEEFLKKYLCKNGCGKCPINHPTKQFPHNNCKFYEFVDEVAYLEDHIGKYLGLKESEKKMAEIACMLYNLAIIGITCYMCANYSYWFLLLLLLTGSYKSDRSE